jgi:hypothetical protein
MYNSAQFASLCSFSEARKNLEMNRHYIADLGNIICKHDLQNRIAVSLLHKHFDITKRELVVKTLNDNGARVEPENDSECKKNIFPYMWKLEWKPKLVQSVQHGLEFLKIDTNSAQFKAPMSDVSLSAFHDEFAKFATERELNSIFGLSIIHTEKLSGQRIWLETTDSKNRILTIEKVLNDPPLSDLTETTWTFAVDDSPHNSDCEAVVAAADKPNKIKPWKKPLKEPAIEPSVEPSIMCTVHCRGHCHSHCTQHCHQHCKHSN